MRSLKSIILLLLTGLFPCLHAQDTGLRLPATPLLSNNPYFSVWSFSDHPGTDWPRRWTGTVQALSCFAGIDGKNCRLLGATHPEVPVMELKGSQVTPTRTIYTFEQSGVRIVLSFTSPMLPDDPVLLSQALTYVSWKVEPTDGMQHKLDLYFDASAELVVNSSEQEVIWSRPRIEGLDIMQMGTSGQEVLKKKGDDLRIDWGYLYIVSPHEQQAASAICGANKARKSFLDDLSLPDDDLSMPRAASDDWPVMATAFSFDKLTSPVERYLVLAYDDLYRVEFLDRKLLPYHKTQGVTTSEMLMEAVRNYVSISERCKAFDEKMTADLVMAGGRDYCEIAVPAYRQSLSACGLAGDLDGTPLFFPKENFSNGCISTVDVIYPACPVLLYCNPALLRAELEPLMIYSSSKRWKFPFAPHDLGTYPLANGQVYGGGELTEDNQMPVEESGNMLIMLYALAVKEGTAGYALKYWPIVSKWAEYLKDKGLDPENQLCTDDFAGHLAHNTNLSIKAIIALGCYAKLCEMTGKKEDAESYRNIAGDFADKWEEMAVDGDHYKLSFDRPGTWSQKYNLVWDRILDLNLFDPAVARTEISYYSGMQNQYGLPLDNRAGYTKLDWIFWTASLTEEEKVFLEFIEPVHRFLNETPDRVPMTDWYDTRTGKQVGFQARPVVGGVFIRLLVP